MELVVYSDGLLATSKGGSSQIGYLIFMAHNNNRASLIDYASKKSRTVVRLAGLFGMVDV